MTHPDATRLQALFIAALDLEPEQREEFASRECADDPGLLTRLRALLSADALLSGTTARSIASGLPRLLAVAAPQASPYGSRVGPYALREELGHGGMGCVYRAERVDGSVAQEVAIKFVRREVLGDDTLRRFRAERATLAALAHPQIARLIDAAELEDGTPYYVMEYVAGVGLIEHCRGARCDLRERVELIRRVCGAVAHAHRNLIVHRDLKPGNILVAADGTPKLLDFGIAKALVPGDIALQTATAQRYFSPQYAAPEQILGTSIGVGCDVYALGLLLYELIAGQFAFDLEGLSAGQVERLITTVPPALPSAVAGRNPAAPFRARELRGDLDGIVMRCLRKGPAERYASVEQLEADLCNYLEGRPVQARGGHAAYRLRKFIGRHRVSVAIAAAALLALATAAAIVLRQNLALTRERDRAEYALEFIKGAFSAADPGSAAGADVSARAILDAAGPKLDELFEHRPDLFASLGGTIAEVELALGLGRETAALSERAVLAAQRAGLDARTIGHLLVLEAEGLMAGGQVAAAEAPLADARRLGADTTPEWELAQGELLARDTNGDAGVAALRRLTIALEDRPPTDLLATRARWQLAEALRLRRNDREALETLDRALDWQRAALPESHARIAQTRLMRVDLLRGLERNDEALVEAKDVEGQVERQFGAHSAFAATARMSYGSTLLAARRYAAAAVEYRAALESWRQALGPDHPSTIRATYNLAAALSMSPETKREAEENYQLALGTLIRRSGARNELALFFRLTYAEFLLRLQRSAEALALLTEADAFAGLDVSIEPNRSEFLQVLEQAHAYAGCGSTVAGAPTRAPAHAACTVAAARIAAGKDAASRER